MSTICTLGICGFRSYSCFRQEVIHFDRPVTLILGKNGSGKTTIIECLRAVTSGTLPPGSNSGRSFLIDPDLVKQSDVTGVLKIKFIAVNKVPILCIRTMNFRKRGEKFEFRKLEQILKSKNLEGKEVAVNCNVNEIDRQIPELLGVSRAILENVIFCHQEDSLWPFREGGTLKTIFDDLFDTTRFTRVNEATKTLIKENRKKMKDEKHKSDLCKQRYETVIENVKKVQSISKDLQQNKKNLQEIALNRSITEAKVSTHKIDELLTLAISSKKLKEYQKAEKEKLLNGLAENCQHNPFRGRLKADVEAELLRCKACLEQLSQQMALRSARALEIHQQLAEVKLLIGGEDVDHRIAIGNKNCEELCKVLSMQPAETLKDTLATARNKCSSLLKETAVVEEELVGLRAVKREKSDRLAEVLEAINSLELAAKNQTDNQRRSLDTLESDIQSVHEQVNELNKRHEKNLELIRLSQLTQEKWKVAKKYQARQKLLQEIQKVKKDISRLTVECRLSSEDLLSLSVMHLENCISDTINKLSDRERTLKEMNFKQVQIDYKYSQSAKKKAELLEKQTIISKRLSKSLGKESVNIGSDSIEKLKAEVHNLEVKIGVVVLLKKDTLAGLLELSQRDHKCYLCLKDFDDSDFEKRLEFFRSWKEEDDPLVNKLKKQLQEKQADLQLLEENKATVDELDSYNRQLLQVDLETRETDIEFGQLKYEVKTIEDSITELTKLKASFKELQMAMTQLDTLEPHLDAILGQTELAQHPPEDLLRLADLAEPPTSENSEALENMSYKCELKDLDLAMNKLLEEKKLLQLANNREELKQVSQEDVEQARFYLEEIEQRYNEKSEYLSRLKTSICRAEILIDAIQKLLVFDESSPEMERFKLLTANKSIVQQELDSLTTSFTEQTKNLEAAEQTLPLIQLQAEIDDIKKQLELQDETILDLKKKREQDSAARKALEELNIAHSRLKGIEESQQKQLQQLYTSIYEDRHVEKEYFSSLTDFEYLRQYVTDLEFYNDSLDKALSNYHQEQIKKINKCIEILWRKTYKNEDILKIEIKADQIFDKPTEKTASSKSNFNYRVVFFGRDELELEMRGRSSMGQKVLASIIIRIALAQAFGINCGVLALDEPTTNLDQANIASLAQFLADLIDQQRDNDGFQLIVITHDDEFIKMFRHYTGHFYHVFKDETGFSRIEKKDIEKY